MITVDSVQHNSVENNNSGFWWATHGATTSRRRLEGWRSVWGAHLPCPSSSPFHSTHYSPLGSGNQSVLLGSLYSPWVQLFHSLWLRLIGALLCQKLDRVSSANPVTFRADTSNGPSPHTDTTTSSKWQNTQHRAHKKNSDLRNVLVPCWSSCYMLWIREIGLLIQLENTFSVCFVGERERESVCVCVCWGAW